MWAARVVCICIHRRRIAQLTRCRSRRRWRQNAFCCHARLPVYMCIRNCTCLRWKCVAFKCRVDDRSSLKCEVDLSLFGIAPFLLLSLIRQTAHVYVWSITHELSSWKRRWNTKTKHISYKQYSHTGESKNDTHTYSSYTATQANMCTSTIFTIYDTLSKRFVLLLKSLYIYTTALWRHC